MKKSIMRVVILFFIILIVFLFTIKNTVALTLTVDQNLWEYDEYDFAFGSITESTLAFDYILTTAPDPGDPSVPFPSPDSLYCSILIGSDEYGLLIADSTGNYPDPVPSFLPAPGTVTVTPVFSSQGITYTLTADISSLSGLSGNIYFELADWGDGYDTTVEIDNIAFFTPTAVPEPSVIFLLGSLILGVFWVNRRFLIL